MSAFSKAIAQCACPKCNAVAGQGCVLKSGQPATSCHNERLRTGHAMQDYGTLTGVLRNNWRQRLVYVYAIPGNIEHVRTVGWTITDGAVRKDIAPVDCVEPIDSWLHTIKLFPATAVYNQEQA